MLKYGVTVCVEEVYGNTRILVNDIVMNSDHERSYAEALLEAEELVEQIEKEFT